MHEATQFDDEGDLDGSTLEPELLPYVEAWRKFRRECHLVIALIEQPIHSPKYRYAGTPDRFGWLNGRRRCWT